MRDTGETLQRQQLGRAVGPDFRRFQLTATLAEGSSAAAKFMRWNGSAWVVSNVTFTVYDAMSQFSGPSGTNGVCWWSSYSKHWEIESMVPNASAAIQSCGWTGLQGTQTIVATSGAVKLTIGAGGGTTANGCTVSANKITISPAGYYTVDAKISADGTAIGGPYLLLKVYKNGANIAGMEYGKLSSLVANATSSTSLHWILSLADADYLELYVDSSSAALNWNVYYADLRVVQILGTP